jgi:hypothetical protein
MDKVDLRIAYVLMVHKNPEQANMFIKQLLTDEQADLYLHIDKNSAGLMAGKLIVHPRIFRTSENVGVTWGDMSQVDAMAILLREVVQSGKIYDFICYRSGQDMMVREGYKEYLSGHKGKSFFDAEEIEMDSEKAALFKVRYPKSTRKLYDSMHPYRILRMLLRKLYGMGINLLPNNSEFSSQIRLYTGATWFSISQDLAEYMVDYLNRNPWFYNAFKESLAPDRMFFNTLAMNSPFAVRIINQPHTYEYWGSTYKTSNHPVIFTTGNVDEIEKTDFYFARKFDMSMDKNVIEYFMHKIIG